jgi:hypothetical protein
MIKWGKTTKEEVQTISRIAKRANKIMERETGDSLDVMSTVMDLEATHTHGCPLKLAELEKADDVNLMHDVLGIARHIDRDTGELTNCFLPRFAA